jgi:hypothetical protein
MQSDHRHCHFNEKHDSRSVQEQLTVAAQKDVSLHQLCSSLKELSLQLLIILEFGNFQIDAISGTHANDKLNDARAAVS